MSLTRTVFLNTSVQLVGRVITTAISLIVVGALTRYLGVVGYGQYSTIFAYVSFLGVLADAGFFWIMLRELSKESADISRIASNVLTLRTVLGVVVFVIGALISFLIPQYSQEIRFGIVVTSFAWFWMTVNATLVGVFQVKHRMDKAVISDIVGRVVILLGVLWLTKNDGGLLIILGAYVVGNFVNFVISLILSRHFVKIRPRFEFDFWRKIFHEAWPMGIVLILGLIYFKIDTLMLSLMKSSAEVGIYGASYKILEVLLTLPTIMIGNIFPTLTRYLTSKDNRLERVFQVAFDSMLMTVLPIIFGVMILAKSILVFVVGQEYVTTGTVQIFGLLMTSTQTLQILIIAVGVFFFSNLFNNILIADGRQRQLIMPNLVFVVINIGLNLIAIPLFSYIGTAIVTVLTEIVVVLILGTLVYRTTGLRPHFERAGKIVLAAVGMAILVWLTRTLPLIIPISVGVVSYPILLLLTGVATPELIRSLLSRQLSSGK